MKNRAEWVGKHISKMERILDIGIKDAYVFHTLGFYPDVAVDIHPEDVPKEVKKHVNFYKASIYDLPFSDNSFSVVTVTEVLEHLKEPEKGIKECMRVGSRVVGTVPRGDHKSKYPQYYEFERGSLLRILGNIGSYTIREIKTPNWEGFGFIISKNRCSNFERKR